MKKENDLSRTVARRSLNFVENHLKGAKFYLNIKHEETFKKVVNRIAELGGQVEDFLSKEVDNLITDSQQKNRSNTTDNDPVVSLPYALSRGLCTL